jgi:hypothetical protein
VSRKNKKPWAPVGPERAGIVQGGYTGPANEGERPLLPQTGSGVCPAQARVPLLSRLQRALDVAQRQRRNGEAQAINDVIVALANARHKVHMARAVVSADVASLLDIVEAL